VSTTKNAKYRELFRNESFVCMYSCIADHTNLAVTAEKCFTYAEKIWKCGVCFW